MEVRGGSCCSERCVHKTKAFSIAMGQLLVINDELQYLRRKLVHLPGHCEVSDNSKYCTKAHNTYEPVCRVRALNAGQDFNLRVALKSRQDRDVNSTLAQRLTRLMIDEPPCHCSLTVKYHLGR